MSTYLATETTISLHEANRSVPVEIHHGQSDPVVPEHLGRNAKTLLSKWGYHPTFRTYSMEHGVCPEQINDISSWFQELLVEK